MSLVSSAIEPWPPNSPPQRHCGRNPSAGLIIAAKARWHDSSGPPPSQGWEEIHLAGGLSSSEICDGLGKGHFSPGGLGAVRRAAEGRIDAGDKLREHRCNKPGMQRRNRCSKVDARRHTRQQRQQGQSISHAALTVGPLQVSSVAVRPFVHGEIYRRPPQRISGWRPLMAPAAALSSSLAPLEPQGFDPRLLNKEALCVGNGVSRGASLTSQANALRQKQLQFRHRVYQSTHKAAGLARLLTVMREDGSSITSTGAGRDSTVSHSSGGRRRAQ